MNGTEKIGCCGAYCKTCREVQKTCKGCKLRYLDDSSGFEPIEIQNKGILSDQWSYHLRRLQGI